MHSGSPSDRHLPCARRATFPSTRRRHRRGISVLEVLIALAIVTVLAALLLPVIGKTRASARSVQCISTLRQLQVAFQLYAGDHRLYLPDPTFTDKSWEQLLLPYFTGSFACPADTELAPTVGSSYDWRDTGNPATTLAGRMLPAVGRTEAVLAFEALPGWHAARRINVVRVDGSAATLTDDACFADLAKPIANGR